LKSLGYGAAEIAELREEKRREEKRREEKRREGHLTAALFC
jgi:hypothetical protein